MNRQPFVDFALRFTSTSVIFKHFTVGLVTTARPVCSSLFFQGRSPFSAELLRVFLSHPEQPAGAGWLTYPLSSGCRRSPAAEGPWADKGPLSLVAAKGNCFRKGHDNGTRLYHYLSLDPQKLKQTARFSFLTHSCARCWLWLRAS